MSAQLLQILADKRAVVSQRSQALLNAADSRKSDLTDTEARSFDADVAELKALTARMAAVTAADAQERSITAQLNEHLGDNGGNAAKRGGWLPTQRSYNELRAVAASGNVFVPAGQAQTFADRLRAHSAIFGAGFQSLPVPNGTLRIPKISASVTVSALAESAAITPSDPTFASSTLTLRKFAALTLASNEAFSDSNPSLREVVGEDLVKQFATFADTQFLAGSGAGANVLGIRNLAGVTAGPSLGANGGTPTLSTFASALTSYETANASVADAVWIMHPRTWGTVRSFVDAQSRYQINPGVTAAEPRSLFGIPVVTSANLSITDTVGTSSDTSWIGLVDKSQIVLGYGIQENQASSGSFGTQTDSLGIEVQLSEDYAFNADQVAVRVRGRFDLVALNAAAVVLTTGVRP